MQASLQRVSLITIAALMALVAVAPAQATTYEPTATNPSWPTACGFDVSIVIDHSNSILNNNAANPDLIRDAAKAFVDGLAGTPSSVSVVSFWRTANVEIGSTSAATTTGVNAIKAAIDGIAFFTSSPDGSTNWDEAFRAVRTVTPAADLVVFITDGRPTVHLANHASGSSTDFADVNEGIKSANLVKALGSRLAAYGVGSGIDAANLALISGPDVGDDYFLTEFVALESRLIDLVASLCGGAVRVTKLVDGAPAPGWAFSASGAAAPASSTTSRAGTVDFRWTSRTAQSTTIVETPRLGFVLDPKDGKNAQCSDGSGPIASSNTPHGFILSVSPTDVITCVVHNRRLTGGLSVIKQASHDTVHSGDAVTYTYTATNAGESPLHAVTATDDKCAPLVRTIGTGTVLDPGAQWTYTCTAVLTATTTNVVTLAALDPLDAPFTARDDATVTVIRPAIVVAKSGPTSAMPGDVITYSFAVTNTGDTTLTGVLVSDNVLGTIGTIATLAPGAATTLTHRFPVPAGNAAITNVATACGRDPLQLQVCDTDNHTLTRVHPEVQVLKSGPAIAHPGDRVTYSFLVTNTGDTTLTEVIVTDDVLGAIGTIESLAAGASQGFTKDHTIPATTTDITNIATVCATSTVGRQVCDTDDHTLDPIHPAIQVIKIGPASAHENDLVTYTFAVTNTGDTTLTGVNVNDDILGTVGTIGTLAPGVSTTLTRTVTVPTGTAAITNVATACGRDPLQREVCETDTHILTPLDPRIQIVKLVNGQPSVFAHEGDELVYSIHVANTSDAMLALSSITDLANGQSVTLPPACLANLLNPLLPGASFTCSYTTQAGADDAMNIARIAGADTLGRQVSAEDEATVDVLHPAISLAKSAFPLTISGSGVVTFTYVATNTGDTELRNILVTDDVLGVVGAVASLAPGASATLLKTQDTGPGSPTRNVGTATGIDQLGKPVTAIDDATVSIVLGVRLTNQPLPAAQAAPAQLPRTGGAPLGVVVLVLVGLGALVATRRWGRQSYTK